MFRRVRNYIFLRDVFFLTLSAFGGPQAHMALFLDRMVKKRAYLSEKDLIELNALCQILPGPTSTQTITAIGFKIGGPNLAYLTLLVWILPAVTLMTLAGLLISSIDAKDLSMEFTKFIQPMAVGLIAYAAFTISSKVVNTKTGIVLMVSSAVVSFFVRSPFIFPILLILGGAITAIKFKSQPIAEKDKIRIRWENFLLWGGVFIGVALIGGFTKFKPILLFENFYRNGSLIFGGGQVLVPLLLTEFVHAKEYLSAQEFLSGFALVQGIPGPTFSFSAYVGALSVREAGLGGEIVGALAASLGIFLPGTFLIFFVIRFWEGLKKYRIVRASLEGVNAVSSGLVAAAAILLFQPLDNNIINFAVVIITFASMTWTRIPAPVIIFSGILAGFIF